MDEALHAALRRGLETFHKTQTCWQGLLLQGEPRDVAAGLMEASQTLSAISVALHFATWAVGLLQILLLFLDLPMWLLLIVMNLGQMPSCELWLSLKTSFHSIKSLLKNNWKRKCRQSGSCCIFKHTRGTGTVSDEDQASHSRPLAQPCVLRQIVKLHFFSTAQQALEITDLQPQVVVISILH